MAKKKDTQVIAVGGAAAETLTLLAACNPVVARLLDLVRERHPSVAASPGCRPFDLTPEVEAKLAEVADLLGK